MVLTSSSFDSPLLSPCRYCGERSQFVVASTTNKMELLFHSDQSYTDTGFSAEFLSYDSSDRELKHWGGESDFPGIWSSSVLTLPCKPGNSLFQGDSSMPCFPANLIFLLCSAISRHRELCGRDVEGTPRGLMCDFFPLCPSQPALASSLAIPAAASTGACAVTGGWTVWMAAMRGPAVSSAFVSLWHSIGKAMLPHGG